MMVALIAAQVLDNIAFVEIEPVVAYQLINAMQECGYKVIVEASNKPTGRKIEYLANRDIHLHQGRYESKLIIAYKITSQVSTYILAK
jgi:hypothetical protein